MQRSFPTRLTLALLAGLLHASAAGAADAEAGRKAFARCASCHQIGPSARAAFGPQLSGIVGRPAAATSDFKYSPAMINSRIVWTEKNLAAFIKAPGDVVPGTKMRFWGIGDAKQVADLVEYLRTAR